MYRNWRIKNLFQEFKSEVSLTVWQEKMPFELFETIVSGFIL